MFEIYKRDVLSMMFKKKKTFPIYNEGGMTIGGKNIKQFNPDIVW